MSGEIFQKKFSGIFWIPEKLSGISRNKFSNLWSLKNLSNWGPIPENLLRISEKTCSWEIPRKFLKASHQNWRTWKNSSLLLPGIYNIYALKISFSTFIHLSWILYFYVLDSYYPTVGPLKLWNWKTREMILNILIKMKRFNFAMTTDPFNFQTTRNFVFIVCNFKGPAVSLLPKILIDKL